jgi:hypothetical protein
MFADATPQLPAAVPLGQPRTYEAVLMAVLFAHEKRLEQVWMPLEAKSTKKDLRNGKRPEGR